MLSDDNMRLHSSMLNIQMEIPLSLATLAIGGISSGTHNWICQNTNKNSQLFTNSCCNACWNGKRFREIVQTSSQIFFMQKHSIFGQLNMKIVTKAFWLLLQVYCTGRATWMKQSQTKRCRRNAYTVKVYTHVMNIGRRRNIFSFPSMYWTSVSNIVHNTKTFLEMEQCNGFY